MNYDFFHTMTDQQSKEYLSAFLTEVSEGLESMNDDAKKDGVDIDYNMECFRNIFDWLFRQINALPKSEDEELPDWIRNTAIYKENLFEFDEKSKILINRFAYYLGEVFVKTFNALYWDIGEKELQFQGMPVVKGFESKLEMPVLVISENLLRKNRNFNPKNVLDFWVMKAPDHARM